MTSFHEYSNYDALALAKLVRTKQVTPAEVLTAAVEGTDRLNPTINAVVTPMVEQARQAVDNGLPQGPLSGVPFLLKDLSALYAGVRLSNGSRFFADYVPDHDSEMVIRHKEGGLVIFGKTNTPELGLNYSTEPRMFGPTRNPWNTDRIAGGSSGGAAAAVAAGIVPVAHASDGGGSIRVPASCCGLFGLKPTRGRNPAGPDRGEGWGGMSVEHVVSRTVRDSAAMLDLTCGPDVGAPYWARPPVRPYLEEVGAEAGPLRVAYSVEPPSGVPVDPECVQAVEDAARLMADLGHNVELASPPVTADEFSEGFRVIVAANVMNSIKKHAEYTGREIDPASFERITWLLAQRGQSTAAAAYAAAIGTIHRIGRRVGQFFGSFDILITPTLAKPPRPLGLLDMMTSDTETYMIELSGFAPFTTLFNISGNPAMSVPLHWTVDNLPVGVQFVGRYGDEATLFRLGAQLEQAKPWSDRRPPVFV